MNKQGGSVYISLYLQSVAIESNLTVKREEIYSSGKVGDKLRQAPVGMRMPESKDDECAIESDAHRCANIIQITMK